MIDANVKPTKVKAKKKIIADSGQAPTSPAAVSATPAAAPSGQAPTVAPKTRPHPYFLVACKIRGLEIDGQPRTLLPGTKVQLPQEVAAEYLPAGLLVPCAKE